MGDRIKRRQALAMLTKDQLQNIRDYYYIESKWSNAENLRKAIEDYWCANENTSIEVDVCRMIRELIK